MVVVLFILYDAQVVNWDQIKGLEKSMYLKHTNIFNTICDLAHKWKPGRVFLTHYVWLQLSPLATGNKSNWLQILTLR